MREFATTAGGINIVVRHLQSMIRIAQGRPLTIQPMPRCIYARMLMSTTLRLLSPPCFVPSFRPKDIQPHSVLKKHSSSISYLKSSLNPDHFAFLHTIQLLITIYKNQFYCVSCLRGLPLFRIGFIGFSFGVRSFDTNCPLLFLGILVAMVCLFQKRDICSKYFNISCSFFCIAIIFSHSRSVTYRTSLTAIIPTSSM